MSLGNNIYELRTAKALSQGRLADMLDVSRQSVSKWETDTAIPDLDKLIKMCDVFGVTLDELTERVPQVNEDVKAIPPTERSSAFTTAKIVGYILLTATLIATALLLALNVDYFLIYFPFLLSPFVCSIVCLCVKNNIGYWCAWVALAPICMMNFYFLGLPFLSTTGGMQIIVFIIMTVIAYKKYKKYTVQTSKNKTILLTVGFFACLSIYVAIIFVPLNWISRCFINYSIYSAFSLLLTYSACYIRTLKSS